MGVRIVNVDILRGRSVGRIRAALNTPGGLNTPPQTTQRLKLVVSYDGSNFAGFQWQKGNVRTVQGEIEKAASRLFHSKSRIVGASRTDGGAHAHGQVAHYDVYGQRDSLAADLLYFNGLLPPDVKLTHLEQAPEGFDSHFSSSGKIYRYLLSSGLPSPFEGKYRWWIYERFCEGNRGRPDSLAHMALDVSLMREAAQHLIGVHDFSAFADAKRPAGLGSLKRKNPKLAAILKEQGLKIQRTAAKNTRHIWRLDVVDEGEGNVMIEMEGNGFLYRMVRMIASALVEVGHRRITPAGLRAILASADRSKLPAAAPPHGLYLMEVLYNKPPREGRPTAPGEGEAHEAGEDEEADDFEDGVQ